MKIGFIGAGRIGRRMIDHLVAAGHDVVVLTRRAEARTEAEADGLDCADTVAETVCDAEVVFSVVLNDEQVRAAFLGSDGALASMTPGATLVQHTTSRPATAKLLAEAGASRGIGVLDAAFSGSPRDVAAGRLAVWVGGDEAQLERVRPLLETYAAHITFVGAPGNGQLMKMVNQAMFVAQVGLALDAVRLARSIGIDHNDVLGTLQHGSAASRALGYIAEMGVDSVGPRLAELMLKDVLVLREVANDSEADLGLLGDVLSSDVVEQQVLLDGSPPSRATLDQMMARS